MPAIEKLEVNAIRIDEIPALDPVTVITQDFSPGKGKIIIECYGLAWSAYWGGMGNRTVREFFVSCDTAYLHKNLWPGNWRRTRNTVYQEKYLTRIIDAVKSAITDAIAAERQAAPAAAQASVPAGMIAVAVTRTDSRTPAPGKACVTLFYRDGSNYKCVWDVDVDDAVARNLGPPDSDGFHDITKLGLEMGDIPLVAQYGLDQDDHPYVTVEKIVYADGSVYEKPDEAE